jgi:hypothetical protein
MMAMEAAMRFPNLGVRMVLVSSLIVGFGAVGVAQTRSSTSKKPAAKVKAAPHDPFGADAITLKDGKILLGQIYDPSPRGGLIVIVRRAWAEANLPEWAAKWTKLERDASGGAVAQRRERIAAWRRDRPGPAGPDDKITPWLDAELARPAGPAEPSMLMVARLSRGEVKTIQRRGKAAARLLRLGWTLDLKDAETRPIAELKDAVEGRGLLASGDTPVSLDALLPPYAEADSVWQLRRAATEVTFDQGSRFIRFFPRLSKTSSANRRPTRSWQSSTRWPQKAELGHWSHGSTSRPT